MTKVNVQEFFKEVREAQKFYGFNIDRATSFVLSLYKDDVDSWEVYKVLKRKSAQEKSANTESNVDFIKGEDTPVHPDVEKAIKEARDYINTRKSNEKLVKIHTREKVLCKEDTEKLFKSVEVVDELSNVFNIFINHAKGNSSTAKTFAEQLMNEIKRQKGGR